MCNGSVVPRSYFSGTGSGDIAYIGLFLRYSIIVFTSLCKGAINSFHLRLQKRNIPCHDNNFAFVQQVHSKGNKK